MLASPGEAVLPDHQLHHTSTTPGIFQAGLTIPNKAKLFMKMARNFFKGTGYIFNYKSFLKSFNYKLFISLYYMIQGRDGEPTARVPQRVVCYH